MHPILLQLGSMNIYSYGLMVALGFSVAAFLVYNRAPRFNMNRDLMIDYLITLLVSGIVGARIFFVWSNFSYYRSNPIDILNLAKGGLVWYGAFIAALLATVWFVKVRKLDFWLATDMLSPYVALGQAFGRIGCYLNGCCYGVPAPQGFILGERHPTQIYSAILLVIISIVLIKWQERRRFAGEIFLGYCMLYAFKRFVIEFLRGDNPRILAGLTISQLISVVAFITALVLFKIKADAWKKGSTG